MLSLIHSLNFEENVTLLCHYTTLRKSFHNNTFDTVNVEILVTKLNMFYIRATASSS